MVRAEVAARSLEELYGKLVDSQRRAHGWDYVSHHDIIRAAARNGCRSYLELGVNQGTTLACAILAGFSPVTGVDRAPERLEPHGGLFYGRAAVLAQDSRIPIGPVDFLLIDSLHYPDHLRAELNAHGPNVSREILIHDTSANPALYDVVVEWVARRDDEWKIVTRDTRLVGWTLCRRS